MLYINLINKPLLEVGILPDNVRGWKIQDMKEVDMIL